MGLRSFLDKIKPQFSAGGRFAKLHSTFDAFETFLYTPSTVTRTGAHIRDAVDMKRTMSTVIVALLPALVFGMYNVGLQHVLMRGGTDTSFWPLLWFGFLSMLPTIIVSYVVGLGIEFAVAQARGHEVNEGFLVTGLLIPMVLPVGVPLWMVALATAFAVVFGKEVFGGTGMNIFNPALLARAFLFFAFPKSMTGDDVWVAGYGAFPTVDGFSGATPLSVSASGLLDKLPSCSDLFMGFVPGAVGETSTLMILIGALFLLITGVGSWRIIFSVFIGGYLMGLIFNAIGANAYMTLPAHYHLIMGGFAFGAVFMATDPVTSAQTRVGKLIYGLLIGAFIVIVRVINPAYPEGTMLVILLMNAFAPLIDYMVIQRNINWRRARALRVAKAAEAIKAHE
ncbi:MAG: NADH:ubiquinone reductase (Na(+)-transporting) subunit B [Bacteroides sp.]